MREMIVASFEMILRTTDCANAVQHGGTNPLTFNQSNYLGKGEPV
jgi:hypothetical protein